MEGVTDMSLPFAPGSETSKNAALKAEGKVDSQRRTIYNLLNEHHLITDEVTVITGLPHQTVTARITELYQNGYVEATGEVRLTRNGCDAMVFKATDKDATVFIIIPNESQRASLLRFAELMAEQKYDDAEKAIHERLDVLDRRIRP